MSHLAHASDYIIAADRGAMVLQHIGIAPHVFCGDADSADATVVAWAQAEAHTTIRVPSEKYATDLAFAIECAKHEAARRNKVLRLTLSCATGGRLDHLLAVVGLLGKAATEGIEVRLEEDALSCRFLSAGTCWEVGREAHALGATFSAVPLFGEACVSERGMRWELDKRRLGLLADEGISNVITSPEAIVSCHSGVLAAILLWQ